MRTTIQHPVAARIAEGAVMLRDLHKRFGQVQAVRGVGMTIAPGEVVAFLGRTAPASPPPST